VAVENHLTINLNVFIFVRRPDVTIAEFVKKERVTQKHEQQDNPFPIAQAEAFSYIHIRLILAQK
jgi:hypothetical protein